ncbi:MAG: hypothetical protein HOV68_26470 [Streptomycetaceae bacterium]|nr:hypothetical protein [Streptomycetaceae bacterium]
MGTDNHWNLDGVGAAIALAVAVLAQRALTGRRLRDAVPAFLARLGTAPVGRPLVSPAPADSNAHAKPSAGVSPSPVA